MGFEHYQKLKKMGFDMEDIQAPVPVCSVQYCEEEPRKDGLCLSCSKKRKKDAVYYSLTEADIKSRIKKKTGEQREFYKENLEDFLKSKNVQALFDNKEALDIRVIISKYVNTYSTFANTSQFNVNNDLRKVFGKSRDKMDKPELVKVLSYLKSNYPMNTPDKVPEFKEEKTEYPFFSVDIDSRTRDTIKTMEYNKSAIFINIKDMPVGIHILPEGGVHIVTLGNKIEIPKEGHVAVFKM